MLDLAMRVADVEVIIALVLAIIFTGGYASLFRWKKTAAGRAVLYLFSAWIAVSLISFLAIWIGPDYWLRPVWRALGWGFVCFALLNLLVVLWRSFRKHEHPLASVEPRHTTEIPTVKEPDDA